MGNNGIGSNKPLAFDPLNLAGTPAAAPKTPTTQPKRKADDPQLSANANKSEAADSVKRPRTGLPGKGDSKVSSDALKTPEKMTTKATEGAENSGQAMMNQMREMNELGMKFSLVQGEIQFATKMVEGVAKALKGVGDGQSRVAGG